jgi:hypothetical protein
MSEYGQTTARAYRETNTDSSANSPAPAGRGTIYPAGLRFHTPIINGHSAEYCRPSSLVC